MYQSRVSCLTLPKLDKCGFSFFLLIYFLIMYTRLSVESLVSENRPTWFFNGTTIPGETERAKEFSLYNKWKYYTVQSLNEINTMLTHAETYELRDYKLGKTKNWKIQLDPAPSIQISMTWEHFLSFFPQSVLLIERKTKPKKKIHQNLRDSSSEILYTFC